MWQWLALDRLTGPTYYALALGSLAVGACRPTSELAPEALPPVPRSQVVEWVREYAPRQSLHYRLRWLYETQQGRTRGRAAVRLAPPDSLRFDYRAPFGRSGAAMIVGNDLVWSKPEQDVEELIPVAPLFWAALGMPRLPGPTAVVTGAERNDSRAWRYAGLRDTLTYLVTASVPRLQAEMRQAGRVVGTADVTLADSTGRPIEAQMVFPEAAALFVITVLDIDTLASIDPSIWKEP